ncbi:MAG: hypothetical protein ACE5F1_12785 [Planctomycetota bacterium]
MSGSTGLGLLLLMLCSCKSRRSLPDEAFWRGWKDEDARQAGRAMPGTRARTRAGSTGDQEGFRAALLDPDQRIRQVVAEYLRRRYPDDERVEELIRWSEVYAGYLYRGWTLLDGEEDGDKWKAPRLGIPVGEDH